MPLIHVVRPFGADSAPSLRWTNGIIAHFSMSLRVRIDARTEVARHHLCPKANSEIGLPVAQRHADPIDLTMHKIFTVVRALRAAENCGAGMPFHGFRQRVAKTGAPDIERVTEVHQSLTDTAGRCGLLMQDE